MKINSVSINCRRLLGIFTVLEKNRPGVGRGRQVGGLGYGVNVLWCLLMLLLLLDLLLYVVCSVVLLCVRDYNGINYVYAQVDTGHSKLAQWRLATRSKSHLISVCVCVKVYLCECVCVCALVCEFMSGGNTGVGAWLSPMSCPCLFMFNCLAALLLPLSLSLPPSLSRYTLCKKEHKAFVTTPVMHCGT